MASEEEKKKKLIKIGVIIGVIVVIGGIAALIYHNHYAQQYKFKGLGDIYRSRHQQYKLFAERKITLTNKGNPPKNEARQFPSFKARFATNLSDRAYLEIILDFRFTNAQGIKEIRRKWERIEFATKIALTPYTGQELIDGDKDEVLVIIENQIRKRIFSDIKYIYLDRYDLRN